MADAFGTNHGEEEAEVGLTSWRAIGSKGFHWGIAIAATSHSSGQEKDSFEFGRSDAKQTETLLHDNVGNAIAKGLSTLILKHWLKQFFMVQTV